MRIPCTNEMLATLVFEELQMRTTAGEEFTAYTVTQAVRSKQPLIEIPHPRVRALVHHFMAGWLRSGHYHGVPCVINSKLALLYQPLMEVIWSQQGVTANLPLLNLN